MKYTDMSTQNEYDMSTTIIAKSDQVNADDLIGGPMTIRINEVKILPSDQPVNIYFDGSEKAFRPCKSMCRVLVSIWGSDSKRYIGKRLRLYRDPSVTWAGVQIGGIRISHASHIDGPQTIMISEKRGKRSPVKILPLADEPIQPAKPSDKAAVWAQGFIDRVNACDTSESLATLISDNQKAIERLSAVSADIAETVADTLIKKREELESA